MGLPGSCVRLSGEDCVVIMDLSLDTDPVQRMERLGLT